ncbi:GDSL-type esterase/lipase family protein [Engelhardtia mirabilis]|uniref:SGNH hydrolase-type esterase domain-containing protein n=1 Tax=Engelhardtia mirabilis TaxID=2528011 RepID=A0A518BEG8_9BACT|nr:hypothetical protein Pla133_04440 [Planctomycetes bacterium Pla133]QDU99705.1 hypothetical protein Pla86_04440 [Planctomycetes bacterium Pla86]
MSNLDPLAQTPLWRRALYALLPTLVLLGLVEVIVRAALPDASGVDLSRGFGDAARYLVREPDGGYRTAMFVRDVDEKVIPPKSETLRVVMLGGSNTEGFPSGWLGERLTEAGATLGKTVEVINLGRRGYGSGRVRVLLPQALELEPDLLVVYSGHNEFVEASFRMDLEQASGEVEGGSLAAVDRIARNLASYRSLQGWFGDRAGLEQAERRPQEQTFEHEKFLGLEWEQTVAKFEEYRKNLETMVADARAAGVPILLCTVAGNDFAAPFVSTPPAGLSEAEIAKLNQALTEARKAQPRSLSYLIPRVPEERLHFEDWLKKDGPTLTPEETPVFTAHRSPFDLAPFWWSRPHTWSKRVRPFLTYLRALRVRGLSEADQAAARASIEPLQRALAIAPDHPEALYRLGLVDYAVGDRERGAKLMRRGSATDRAPRKGTQYSNDIVREVSARLGVPLADVEQTIRARCPDGLIGFELMRDECHFHQAPRYVVMLDVAEAVVPVLFPALGDEARAEAKKAWGQALLDLIRNATTAGERELVRGG